ncbi:MAG: ABC transporter permease [Myxococcales bacterium]|nr:MAG: ABC transporter permease [Myxococcales bacterium]
MAPPGSSRGSIIPPGPAAPEAEGSALGGALGWVGGVVTGFLERLGDLTWLFVGSLRVLFKRPLEAREVVQQLESIGVKSTGLVLITGSFVGMVMALQFVLGLQKFGGMEYTGRIISLSFSRELAPSLTAVIVGSRIASGIAAEIGSMNVTEQIDAIRALGADPVKKLVMPRLVASIVAMPIMAVVSLILGLAGAVLVCSLQFGLSAGFFMSTALDALQLQDFWSGYLKTPVFGAIIALVGCHCGLRTRGGTQGVGASTTDAVVITSVTILIADLILTNLFAVIFRTPT